MSQKALGNHFQVQITPREIIFFLTLTLISSFVGYFFVPGPLGGLKSVSGDVFGHDIIYILSKNELFSKGLVQGFWSKMAKY